MVKYFPIYGLVYSLLQFTFSFRAAGNYFCGFPQDDETAFHRLPKKEDSRTYIHSLSLLLLSLAPF
ncbi:hypothetical protein OUZ56_023754 [Daphnia magna]|uniref:Uncharacterized protein n=1 Tax=Daphnia magna TaxID=35525 RepID=A0ABR0AZG7_9CRUS|nr:hypothetical protein OUZ56_023754 [Daphnia magna]